MPDFEYHLLKMLDAEEKWDSLFGNCKIENPFLSWSWNYRWVKKFGNIETAVVHLITKNDDVVALAFLEGSKNLKFMADPFLADYSNFLVDPNYPEALSFLLKGLLKKNMLKKATFHPIRQCEYVTQFFVESLDDLNLIWRENKICPNPFVNTENNFDAYLLSLKKSLRQDLKTSANNLSKRGNWAFLQAEEGQIAQDIFKALVDFHLKRQSNKVGSSIFNEIENIEFFNKLFLEKVKNFKPHLSAIVQNEKIISAVYSIHCGKTFFYWIPSFDNSIKSVSLGKLHIKLLIENCFKSEMKIFDFMGGAEQYKYQWAAESYDLLRFSVFKNDFQAHGYDAFFELKDSLKSIKKKSPLLELIWKKFSKYGSF